MWRHGDILIAATKDVPGGAQPVHHAVLATGEITGHAHRMAEPEAVSLWSVGDVIYMQVMADSADLVHEEHATITLPKGIYRVWHQREYTPKKVVRVSD